MKGSGREGKSPLKRISNRKFSTDPFFCLPHGVATFSGLAPSALNFKVVLVFRLINFTTISESYFLCFPLKSFSPLKNHKWKVWKELNSPSWAIIVGKTFFIVWKYKSLGSEAVVVPSNPIKTFESSRNYQNTQKQVEHKKSQSARRVLFAFNLFTQIRTFHHTFRAFARRWNLICTI